MSASFHARISPLSGPSRDAELPFVRMYNLGSATRDPAVAVPHQEEVAKSGIHIAFDIPAPRIYPIARHALTQDDEIFVQSEATSGEVEIVIHVADQIYVGVGSDHTDRTLETVSIQGSKQACPNHLAPVLWPFDEIADDWDQCVLRSWVDGRLYQEVGVDAFLKPADILGIVRERVGDLPERDFTVFCGTIVSVDKALGFGANWRYQLEDPGNDRRIEASYRVIDIRAEMMPDYRVPYFNPKKE